MTDDPAFEELLAQPCLQFDPSGELLPHLIRFGSPPSRPWLFDGAATTTVAYPAAEQASEAVNDESLLADLRRVCATADPPPTALPWSNPAADPIADMREWWERAMDVPYRMGGPVLSPQLKAALDREMVRVNERHRIDQFRREIAWRRFHAKRLTPMYAAYRHRARRRTR